MTVRIKQLYYITHIDNISSILRRGILSHKTIVEQNIDYTHIYDTQIVSNRKDRLTPDKKSLWEYANLYFQARNPMLYRVVCEQSADNLAVLGVDLDVKDLAGAFVTSGNAASISSEIILAKEYWKVIKELEKVFGCEYWKDEDHSKRKIMAECLVPERIDPSYIKEIYVANNNIAEKIRKQISEKILIIPEPRMFFNNPLIAQLTPNFSIFKGDMFFSRMHTLTVSVNIVGIMGKGLASRAKYQFPDVYVLYQDLCRKKTIRMGKPYIYKRGISLDFQLADESASLKNGNAETWFLLFPTKNHWREDADFAAIERGMQWLKENYEREGVKSLAIPALGCGLGKLGWEDVGPMLCKYLRDFNVPVQLYIPTERQIPEHYLKREFLLAL
ncbi:MAG: DarT ssDNA thymidine ADP-ribosyltransferase family protein [bacterium]